jgi:hypothetical protein
MRTLVLQKLRDFLGREGIPLSTMAKTAVATPVAEETLAVLQVDVTAGPIVTAVRLAVL